MRVLMVATAYPRNAQDVITPWLVELIRRLRARGIEIEVFTSSYQGLGDQVHEGVKVRRFRYFVKKLERLTHEENATDRFSRGVISKIAALCYIIFGTAAMIRLMGRTRYDVVHVHWPFPHILFGLAAKKFGRARLVATFYGLEVRWLKNRFPFLLRPSAWLFRKADMVTAISTHTAAELTSLTSRPVPVIPFSIAVEPGSGARQDGQTILFVGRLVQRKGVPVLLEAFRRVMDRVPHRLVIVGDGPDRHQLQQLAYHLGCGDRAVFTGWVSGAEKARQFQACTCFVLPAVYDRKGDTEALGVVLLEAMACAKPVVASQVGGITDIVEHDRNGLLVPAGDPQALADAILRLVGDAALRERLGVSARRTVDEKFNWDRIVERLMNVYETCH